MQMYKANKRNNLLLLYVFQSKRCGLDVNYPGIGFDC